MCRLRRVPRTLDKFFRPRHHHWHGPHGESCRGRGLVMAGTWGRPQVANFSRALEAQHQRTRFQTCFLGPRWAPQAARQPKAQERRQALAPQPGDPVELLRDDATQATRGPPMAAVATRQAPTTAAAIRGPPEVGGLLRCRPHVIPGGLRLSGKQAAGAGIGVPFHNTTALAAPLLRAFQAPAGIKVPVWCAADSRCPTVVPAGREQRVHVAATRKSHRRLCTPGGKRPAGR
jgi:hypothetical protein